MSFQPLSPLNASTQVLNEQGTFTGEILRWFTSLTRIVNREGIASFTQAILPTMGAHDVGTIVEVTDYAHTIRWTGTAWTWGPGDLGSGYFADFASVPNQVGWHLCDGSTVMRLNPTGTLTAVVLPVSARYFRQ